MTLITFSDIDSVLKKVIAPKIESQYAKGTLLLDALPSNRATKDPMNQYFYITLRYSRNPAIGPLTTGWALPTAGNPKYDQTRIDCKYIVGRFQLPEPILDSARNSKQALVNLLTDHSEDLQEGMKKDTNRMLFGDGTGQLALCNGGNVTTATTALAAVDTPGTDYLYEGLELEINGQDTSVSKVLSATAVTLGTAVTWDDNDVITKRVKTDWMGLGGIVAITGTVQNIAKGDYYWWQSHVDSDAEALTLADMQAQFRNVEKFGKCDLIVTNPVTRDAYSALLTSYKTMGLPVENKFGYKGPEFNNVPVIGDFDCPEGTMYMLDKSALSREQLVPMGWMDREGHVLKSVPGYAAYEAILKNFGNLATNNCKKLAKLTGKT